MAKQLDYADHFVTCIYTNSGLPKMHTIPKEVKTLKRAPTSRALCVQWKAENTYV